MHSLRFFLILCLLLGSLSMAWGQVEPSELNLHVPSPAWEDQIIYFLMIDRFNDGDTTNNDLGYGEYDPEVYSKYSGGDIQGVIDKLDYIQDLGATAVWITPPVANQWWDDSLKYGGYHGYWAENFKEVDQHVGTLLDFQKLSHHLHERGMYLIQDIVVNHTGNFFYQAHPAEEDFFLLNQKAYPSHTPSQYPFNLNDKNNPDHREAGIYHWTPDIQDYSDPEQLLNFQLGGLDDINTQNVVVREVFRDSYGYWIRVVGVDGFRIDTVIYVEKDFWNDFLYAESVEQPGIMDVAAATGREDFIAFGEPLLNSPPFSNVADVEVVLDVVLANSNLAVELLLDVEAAEYRVVVFHAKDHVAVVLVDVICHSLRGQDAHEVVDVG